MIKQPEFDPKRENIYFYRSQKKYIAMLNEVFGDVKLNEDETRRLIWLTNFDTSTLKNIVSAIKKAIGTAVENRP